MAEIHDLVAPYVLDALDPDEAREFESHLDTCESCRAELFELSEGAADIAESVSVTPPPGVKQAVMAVIDEPDHPVIQLDSRRYTRWQVVTAAAAVMALVFAGLWFTDSQELDRADLVAAVYEAPDATFVDLETANGPARLAYSPSLQRGVLNGGRLVDVGEDDIYQLWLIEGGEPVSAGTFEPGDTDVVVEAASPGAVLAMTIETSPGVSQPTSDPLFAAEL